MKPQQINEEAVERFRRDGMLFLPGVFDASTIADLDRWTASLQEEEDRPGYVWKYSDDEARDEERFLLSRIEHFVPHHEGLRRFALGEPIRSLLTALLDDAPVLFKDKINYKLPGGAGFAPHQDVQAGWAKYGPTHLTVLVSVDAASEESGCLEVAAGSGRDGMVGDEWRPLDGEVLESLDFQPFPTQPGDVMVFDSFVAHRSQPNHSDQPRRVLYLSYNAAAYGDQYERYFADKHASYPPDIERDPRSEYRYRV